MPLDNSLNVSELLRRLGVKGDSLGSAPLLESLRLNLMIADLSQLVPPLRGPIGGATIAQNAGAGFFNQWTLECRAPGGLEVQTLQTVTNGSFALFITPARVTGAAIQTAQHNYSFGQAVDSIFTTAVTAARVAPTFAFQLRLGQPSYGTFFQNWVGPGEFFNIEANVTNTTETIMISWKEYPAALNPG